MSNTNVAQPWVMVIKKPETPKGNAVKDSSWTIARHTSTLRKRVSEFTSHPTHSLAQRACIEGAKSLTALPEGVALSNVRVPSCLWLLFVTAHRLVPPLRATPLRTFEYVHWGWRVVGWIGQFGNQKLKVKT